MHFMTLVERDDFCIHSDMLKTYGIQSKKKTGDEILSDYKPEYWLLTIGLRILMELLVWIQDYNQLDTKLFVTYFHLEELDLISMQLLNNLSFKEKEDWIYKLMMIPEAFPLHF
jgi:hypothetical protein